MYKRFYDIDRGVDIKLYDIVEHIGPDIGPDIDYQHTAKQTAMIMKVGDSFVVPGVETWQLRHIHDRSRRRIYSMRQREFGVRVWRHA